MDDLTFFQALGIARYFFPSHAWLDSSACFHSLSVNGRLYLAATWCEVFARAGVDLAPRS